MVKWEPGKNDLKKALTLAGGKDIYKAIKIE